MLSPALSAIRPITLYLLVIMSGLLGGIHFASIMAPVAQKMNTVMFTEYWQIVDSYMGQRMPFFGMTFLALFVINLILFIKKWRGLIFWIILICLLILIADIILTGQQQLPINKYIQSVDVRNLTEQQLITLGEMKVKGENFIFGEILSLISFTLLSITPIFYPAKKFDSILL